MSVLEVSLAKQLATETVHGQFRWVSLNSHWVAFGCRSSWSFHQWEVKNAPQTLLAMWCS
jgi:hypothetical protein